MSGGQYIVFAQYIKARLCPRGCGDTLHEYTDASSSGETTYTLCDECCFQGESFSQAESRFAALRSQPATSKEAVRERVDVAAERSWEIWTADGAEHWRATHIPYTRGFEDGVAWADAFLAGRAQRVEVSDAWALLLSTSSICRREAEKGDHAGVTRDMLLDAHHLLAELAEILRSGAALATQSTEGEK